MPAAGRHGGTVVAMATVVYRAAMERLAVTVNKPKRETGHLASGASGSVVADKGRSAAGAATTAALAAHLSA